MQVMVFDTYLDRTSGISIKKDFGYAWLASFCVTQTGPMFTIFIQRIQQATKGAYGSNYGTLLTVFLVTILCSISYLWIKFVSVRFLPRDIVPEYMFYALFLGDIFTEAVTAGFNTGFVHSAFMLPIHFSPCPQVTMLSI